MSYMYTLITELTDLSISMHFVSKLDFREGDGFLHPVSPKVRRIWVHVDGVVCGRFSLSSGYPVPVHVLPPVVFHRAEVQ